MTNQNFCYWLKGFFELSDAKTLSRKQVVAIIEHLKLTTAVEKKLVGFALWLDGYLKGLDLKVGLNKDQTNQIKSTLKSLFLNVMDLNGRFSEDDFKKTRDGLPNLSLDLYCCENKPSPGEV